MRIRIKAENQTDAAFRAVHRNLQSISQGFSGARQGALGFGTALTGGLAAGGVLGATVLIGGLTSALVGMGRAFISAGATQRTYQLGLKNVMRDGEAAARMFKELQRFADWSPFGDEDVFPLAERLIGFGFSAGDLIGLMTDLGDAAGGDSEKFNRLGISFGQMLTKGRVQGEELLQLAEAGIPAYDILRQKLGLSAEQMQKIGDLNIPATRAIQALREGLRERFGGGMAEAAQEVPGLLSTLGASWMRFISVFGQGLEPVTKRVLQDLIAMLGRATAAAEAFVNSPAWREFIEAALEWWRVFSPVIELVARLVASGLAFTIRAWTVELRIMAAVGRAFVGVLQDLLRLLKPVLDGFRQLGQFLKAAGDWWRDALQRLKEFIDNLGKFKDSWGGIDWGSLGAQAGAWAMAVVDALTRVAQAKDTLLHNVQALVEAARETIRINVESNVEAVLGPLAELLQRQQPDLRLPVIVVPNMMAIPDIADQQITVFMQFAGDLGADAMNWILRGHSLTRTMLGTIGLAIQNAAHDVLEWVRGGRELARSLAVMIGFAFNSGDSEFHRMLRDGHLLNRSLQANWGFNFNSGDGEFHRLFRDGANIIRTLTANWGFQFNSGDSQFHEAFRDGVRLVRDTVANWGFAFNSGDTAFHQMLRDGLQLWREVGLAIGWAFNAGDELFQSLIQNGGTIWRDLGISLGFQFNSGDADFHMALRDGAALYRGVDIALNPVRSAAMPEGLFDTLTSGTKLQIPAEVTITGTPNLPPGVTQIPGGPLVPTDFGAYRTITGASMQMDTGGSTGGGGSQGDMPPEVAAAGGWGQYNAENQGKPRNPDGTVKTRQFGGNVWPGEVYWVGERGPEPFIPGRSGTILPNEAMGTGALGVSVHIHGNVYGEADLVDRVMRQIDRKVRVDLGMQRKLLFRGI